MKPVVESPMEVAKDAIFDAVMEILELDEKRANAMIRFSWETGTGSSSFSAKPTTDVCYIRVEQTPMNGTGVVNTVYSHSGAFSLQGRYNMHVSLKASITLYGGHCAEYASRIYMGMNTAKVQRIFRRANMAVIPGQGTPTYVPELIDGIWFDRTDVTIPFYMAVEYTDEVSELEKPDFKITTI